jgi:hypothetical protein
MQWTACDKRPQGRESFRKALAIAVGDGSRRDPLWGSWGPHWDNRFRRSAAGTAGDALVKFHPTQACNRCAHLRGPQMTRLKTTSFYENCHCEKFDRAAEKGADISHYLDWSAARFCYEVAAEASKSAGQFGG